MRADTAGQRRAPYAWGGLVTVAVLLLVVHTLTNGAYGFHRDELQTVADARHLAWGYVVYPPFTPLMGRVSLVLFGPSLAGIRVFPALAMSVAALLTGLIAAEMSGPARAQVVAAILSALAPIAMISGALYQYVAFDYLWWVAAAYCVVRILAGADPRWWLAVGVTVGLGMLTKYTMAFFVTGVLVGLVLTSARRHLADRWLWAGVALSLVIFLPHALWEARHGWTTLTFLQHIHARDVRAGRADGFVVQQLYVATFALSVPLWLAGLYRVLLAPAGARFRAVGWMYLVPLVLLIVARGRFYYLAGAYPMLIAAGAVTAAEWLRGRGALAVRLASAAVVIAVAIGVAGSTLLLPIGAIGSPLWNARLAVQHEFNEEVGWPDLARTVGAIAARVPATQRGGLVVLAGNYGEAGALELYGPAYHVPPVISPVNSFFERGYGGAPPPAAIVVGYDARDAAELFTHCTLVAHNTNAYGVENEETRDHPDILVCTGPRADWATQWRRGRQYG